MKKILFIILILINPSFVFATTYIITTDGQVPATVDRETGYVRTTSANYRRYYHAPTSALDPGASGATFTPPDANTVGGYQLDAAGEVLYFGSDIHDDWDGVSNIFIEYKFAVNVNNTGGNVGDTVDIKVVSYYNSAGDTSTKTQTDEIPTTVGQSEQYKVFSVTNEFEYDAADNNIEAGDLIEFALNLETDTSEVDNIIILDGSVVFYYSTTHLGVEAGDV